MQKRSRNRLDFNQIARRIVDQATGDAPLPVEPKAKKPAKPAKEKDPAAVALGRKGGLVGGKARAEKMTAKQRSASAKRAAEARWAESKSSSSD